MLQPSSSHLCESSLHWRPYIDWSFSEVESKVILCKTPRVKPCYLVPRWDVKLAFCHHGSVMDLFAYIYICMLDLFCNKSYQSSWADNSDFDSPFKLAPLRCMSVKAVVWWSSRNAQLIVTCSDGSYQQSKHVEMSNCHISIVIFLKCKCSENMDLKWKTTS